MSICDIGAGLAAHSGILEALIERSTTGAGSPVKVSLFDVAAEWMTVPLTQHEGGATPTRVGLHHPSIAPYGAYATGDGHLTLISIQNDREWIRLCTEALDRPDLATDERFATNADRVRHRPALDDQLTATISQLDRPGFEERLAAADIAFGSVNSLDDLAAHVALRRRTIESSTGVGVALPAHPTRATEDVRRVPGIGEHTDAIRAEFG